MIHFDLESRKLKIEELTKLTEQDDFWKDQKNSKKVISELNMNKKLIEKYNNISQLVLLLSTELNNEQLSADYEMLELINEEFNNVTNEFNEFEIETLLTGPYDKNNVILEFHPGAGGTEAQDWADMLFNMYLRFAEKKGLKAEVLDYQEGNEAGIKSASILISGDNAFGYLKGESGVHRLVRISPFDSNKSRHTSFASVEATPEIVDDGEIIIKDEELKIDTFRASGAGGQHINKTESAVRCIHNPTGIIVACQDGRSQHANKEKALQILAAKVQDFYVSQVNEQVDKERKIKIGSGERSEKIRTYNYPQNRVTDHRIGFTIQKLDRVMEGDLQDIIDALTNEEQKEKLEAEM